MSPKKIQNTLLLVLTSGYLINPFGLSFLFGYGLLVILLLGGRPVFRNLDTTGILLLFFSLVYAIFYSFNPDKGLQFVVIYGLTPVTFYLLGRHFYSEYPKKVMVKLLLALAFFHSFTGILSVLPNLIEGGFIQIQRNLPLFWNQRVIPATNMASLFTLTMCFPAILIQGAKQNKKWLNILLVLIFLVSLVCIIRLGSRTQLAVTLFTIAFSLIYKMSKQSAVKNFMLIIGIFGLLNIGLSYVSLDKDSEILTAYASRMEDKKHGTATAGGRTNQWMRSFENMTKKPLGWDLNEFGYSHNLWLDTFRVGGILSFILLTFLTLRIYRKIIYLFTHKDGRFLYLNGILLIYGLCIFLSFFVESILDGYFELFVLYCFLAGVSISHHAHITNRHNKTSQISP